MKHWIKRIIMGARALTFLVIMLGISSGCSTLSRNPVPQDKMLSAKISGITDARAWSGSFSNQFEADLLLSVQQEMKYVDTNKSGRPITSVLSLSGGGDHGAFGAGFMQGWSQSGSRPEFKLVTGISTGALIATFAFLGSEYDSTLKQAYTTVNAENIYFPRWLSFPWSDAFADTAPLARLIKGYITKDVLQAIAQAHKQGRRLYVGTTNLDADRLIVWNMGVIANSRDPKALGLFRQILLASSSIPVVFPPVFIEVEIDGVSYDEMHVDGGVKAQLFLLAATLNLVDFRKKLDVFAKANRLRSIFIIRNAEIGPEPKPIHRNLAEISKRALSSLTKAQAMSDLNRIYELAREQNLDFNWVAVPAEYERSGGKEFNTDDMNRLFKIGYEMGLKENIWRIKPPKIGRY